MTNPEAIPNAPLTRRRIAVRPQVKVLAEPKIPSPEAPTPGSEAIR